MANDKQKSILITGATAGIGRETALYLAANGWKVIASGRKQALLAELAAESAKAGFPLSTVALDVTDADSIARAVVAVDELTGPAGLDVLCNNAGYGLPVAVEDARDADLRAQYETNVFGLVATIRAFVPGMRARGRGRIVNVSSIGGRFTLPIMGVYNSTKYAVESLSDAMRVELRPFGIDVVLVEPGAIRTNFVSTGAEVSEAYQGSGHYADMYARYQQLAEASMRFAPGPRVIARAIRRAASARWPRARYVAPLSAAFMVGFARLLPTRLIDWMLARVLRVKRLPPPPAARAVASPSLKRAA